MPVETPITSQLAILLEDLTVSDADTPAWKFWSSSVDPTALLNELCRKFVILVLLRTIIFGL